mgnify:CR=1 FL=1
MALQNTVLITGAGTRVGAHLAKGLSEDGWHVAVHYNRSKLAADLLIQEIKKAGGEAVGIQGNLVVPQDVDTLIDRAASALGAPLTALINNASTYRPDLSEDFTRATYDYHMDVNLRAAMTLTQAFAAQSPKTANASVINMIDQRVLKPNPLYFTYSMSKAALYWATKTLAQSLAPTIRVNGVGPGPTYQNTQQTLDAFEAECALTLLERGSPPEEILRAARYLLSATSVTGQMIAVDGGQHLNWDTADLTLELINNPPEDYIVLNPDE